MRLYAGFITAVLSTPSGRAASELVGMSLAEMRRVATGARDHPNIIKSNFNSLDCALVSVSLLGMSLIEKGGTEFERISGLFLQNAIGQYADQHEEDRAACKRVLEAWLNQPDQPDYRGSELQTQDLGTVELLKSRIQLAWTFLSMQASWVEVTEDLLAKGADVFAAFLYGVWDASVEDLELGTGLHLAGLRMLVCFYFGEKSEEHTRPICDYISEYSQDSKFQKGALAGSEAFKSQAAGARQPYFPVELSRCLSGMPD